MAQQAAPALMQLLNRAATITRPFNTQDAILLIKALHALRLSSPNNVRTVCEKAAFALASAPKESVPVSVAVDNVHALIALQAGSLPIVHKVLTKRFLELGKAGGEQGPVSHTTRPTGSVLPVAEQRWRTLQKAALTLMKLGRRHAPPEVCEAVLRGLHAGVAAAPDDIALRLAYIGLYPYSKTSAESLCSPRSGSVRPSLQTLLVCAQTVLDRSCVGALQGNAAWQALHLYPALAHVDAGAAELAARSSVDVDQWLRHWTAVRHRFVGQVVDLNRISPHRYADFLADFAERLCVAPDLLLDVVRPLTTVSACESATRFDIAKVASALAAVVTSPSSGETSIRGRASKPQEQLMHSCALALEHMTASPTTDMVSLTACWHLAACLCRAKTGHGGGGDAAGGGEGADDAASTAAAVDVRRLAEATVRVVREAAGDMAGAAAQPHAAVLAPYAWMAYSVSRVCVGVGSEAHVVLPVWHELLHLLGSPGVLAHLPIRSLAQLVLASSLVRRVDSTAEGTLVALLDAVCTSTELSIMTSADLGMLLDGAEAILARTCGDSGGDDQVDAEEVHELREATLKMLETLLVSGQVDLSQHDSQRRALDRTHRTLMAHGRILAEWSVPGHHTSEARPHAAPLSTDAAHALATPAQVWERLKQSGDRLTLDEAAAVALACRCSGRWAEHLLTGDVTDPRHYGGLVLKCADACHRRRCRVTFATRETAADDVFSVPVVALLGSPRFSSTDAAHVVRLMADSLLRTNAIPGVSRRTVVDLVDYAIAADDADGISAPALLFLLHANRHVAPSTKLFTNSQLLSLLSRAEALFAELLQSAQEVREARSSHAAQASMDPRQQLMRLTRALVNSQVFLRLGPAWTAQQSTFKAAVVFTRVHLPDSKAPATMDFNLKASLLYEV